MSYVLGLGRSVVVSPDERPPEEWGGCDRVSVESVDAETADRLHRAWRDRQPLVIELTPGLGLDDPAAPPPETVTGLQPWEWPVDLDLPAERLHHAVWANSVDGRGGDGFGPGGGGAGFRWAEQARRAGARPSHGEGDVLLPDGRPALCDGGPLDTSVAARAGGLAVLHRVAIEHGSLTSLHPAGPDGVALAADQLAAVAEPRAGARVIAPAGSGKTRVLTERARLLIGGWRLPPQALALVAYNVRAAAEMRDRLEDVGGLRIRTLNALALRLSGRASTLDEPEVRRVLSRLVSFPKRAETDPAAPWIEALGRVRLGLADPADVEDELPDVSDLDRVAREYRAELEGRDAADFDEQIAAAIQRLLGDAGFRARSQRFARILLVDEFQDLTPAHLLLLRLLCGPAGALFAVGDDDQTIYGYAGATPRWLVDFERWFPGSASHALEVNYRCPPAVVTAAANLLTRNTVRVPKVIRAAGEEAGGGGATDALTVLRPGEDEAGPARRTADRVEGLLAGGADPAQVAVLSRVNSSLVPVQVLLSHRGVPLRAGGDRRFLQRGGVRGALAWLEVASSPGGQASGAALREAARRPKRGMSNSLLDLLARRRGGAAALEGLASWLEEKGSEREADKVTQLAADVAMVRRAAERGDTASVLRTVRTGIGNGGLDASASALDQWSHGAIAAHLDDLDALSELAHLEPDPGRFPLWLAERLDAPPSEEGVTLASIHAVKGREWPHVVLHHVTDGLLPHRLAEDMEEERRVFHVGITRAVRSVTVVAGDPPSPFIAETSAPAARPPGQPAGWPETGWPETGWPDAGDGSGRRGSQTSGIGRAAAGRGRADRLPAGGGAAGGGAAGMTRAGRDRAGPQEGRGPRGGAPAAAFLPALAGTSFLSGGHEHQVLEAGEEGAVSLLGGGPGRSVVRYGTPVTADGRPAVLAHPAAESAWTRLREWRSERARSQQVPAFVVLDDRTLRQVAAALPVTEAGLLSISGIGPVKLDSYGSDLIALAEAFRQDLRGSRP